ncbi:hypothetical protein STVA_46570 [Allostella vacuolata]|nr:hypothetical protein STVA_46570 [Stella vacuolata]
MKAPMFAAALAAAVALPMAANAVVVVNETTAAGTIQIFYPANQAFQKAYNIGARSYMDITGAACSEGRTCRIWIMAPAGMRQCVVDVTNNAATVTVKGQGLCEVR